jgi:hypothetical protein
MSEVRGKAESNNIDAQLLDMITCFWHPNAWPQMVYGQSPLFRVPANYTPVGSIFMHSFRAYKIPQVTTTKLCLSVAGTL